MNQLPLDHIAIAVRSLDEALPIWEAVVGAEGYGREAVPDQGVDVVFIGDGAEQRLDLAANLHHLCYRVPDLRAAIQRFSEAGFQPIDREPRRGAHGHLATFFDPRSTGGVLIELIEGDG